MNIACVTFFDALDPRSFGGRVYHQLQAMRGVATMDFIGPLSYMKYAPMLFLKREYYQRVRGLQYYPRRDSRLVRDYPRQIHGRLKDAKAQVIFSSMSPASQPIAFLEAKQPIVIWTDTTFAGALDFYTELMRDDICAETLRDGIENERMALNRAALAIFYTDWAAQDAIRFYNLDPAKVRVIAPGPGVDPQISYEEAKRIVHAKPKDRCRLLFVGMAWERKGGDIVLEVAKKLNAAGLPTELMLVGCDPPTKSLPDFVHALGYIDRKTLDDLYKSCHFMFVPTQAEALGLVFLEASAFALPSLSTDVGGVPEVIKSGVTGATFPLSAGPDKYAKYIEDLFANYHRYEPMALSAFNDFQTRLNNRTAAESVVSAMRELI